jgi:hypothetical protein
MSRRRPVPAAHAAVVVLLAACSYDVDAEYSRVIEVDADRPCPDGDAVAEDEGFDSGELASERVVLRRRPLCWYRVEDRSARGLCTGTWKSERTLDQARSFARDPRNAAPVSGIVCTDGGPVLLVVADSNGCEPSLDGRDVEDFSAERPDDGEQAFPKELLASDDHAGTKACEYVIEGRRTRRPFSCGGDGTALN